MVPPTGLVQSRFFPHSLLKGMMMILKGARIREFKCIDDSGEFEVPQVTCLVGKNESGKTALLQALYKLNPNVAQHADFVDLEYPRRKWRPSMDADTLPRKTLSTTWQLQAEDQQDLIDHFGMNPLTSPSFTVTKGYDNKRRFGVEIDEAKLVDHLLGNANLSGPEGNKLRPKRSVEELLATLESLERSENQERFFKVLQELFPGGTAKLGVIRFLNTRLPKFVYFSEYYILPGEVSLDAFAQRKSSDELSIPDRVFEALLALAGTSPEDVSDITTFERLRASLEAVSNRLSDEIFEYWSQNAHLEVTFSFDHARPDDPPPFNTGYIFRTAIRNRRHKSTVSFDERSSGFVWFFSFLVWFSQVRDVYGDNLIILLDEPALNLHARAQADLLRYFDERLAPSFQVIYTTHSPFLINPDHLLDARTVEDVVEEDERGRERFLGTKVRDDVLAVDPDTISPLQAAVGYDITQTLFVGKHTLIVEGPSDLLYLKWFSERARERARLHLDRRWVICPVGGIDKVNSFAALFASNALNIAVLVDLHKGQKGKVRTLKESRLLRSGAVFTPDMYLEELDEGDTEDLIGWDNYAMLVNHCYSLSAEDALDDADHEGGRVLESVERAMALVKNMEVPNFDHYTPAEHLVQHGGQLKDRLPDLGEALDRFESLFEDLNGLLPPPN